MPRLASSRGVELVKECIFWTGAESLIDLSSDKMGWLVRGENGVENLEARKPRLFLTRLLPSSGVSLILIYGRQSLFDL